MQHKKVQNGKLAEVDGLARKPYQKPALRDLGKITSLTMGTQKGGGESGQAGTRKNRAF